MVPRSAEECRVVPGRGGADIEEPSEKAEFLLLLFIGPFSSAAPQGGLGLRVRKGVLKGRALKKSVQKVSETDL